MEFVRKIINSDKLSNVVTLPDELKHQNVELIILPIAKNKSESGTSVMNGNNPMFLIDTNILIFHFNNSIPEKKPSADT